MKETKQQINKERDSDYKITHNNTTRNNKHAKKPSTVRSLIQSPLSHRAGSFQEQFGYEECTDVCDSNYRTKCAANTDFSAKKLAFDSPEWIWSSRKIKAGKYSAMIALDPSCWDRRGRLSQSGKNLEAVEFVVPSIGSEVVISYHEDVELVTVTVYPLVEKFICEGLEPYTVDWEFYGDCELIKLSDSSAEAVEKYNSCVRRGTPAAEYNKFFRPLYGSGGTSEVTQSCGDPSMMVGNYTIQVLGARKVPALEFLEDDLSDPFVEFTLPNTDPRGRWVSGVQPNCADCEFDAREDMVSLFVRVPRLLSCLNIFLVWYVWLIQLIDCMVGWTFACFVVFCPPSKI